MQLTFILWVLSVAFLTSDAGGVVIAQPTAECGNCPGFLAGLVSI